MAVMNSYLETCQFPKRAKVGLLVQDDTEEGAVDLKPAIVMNEAQFPEFVHEEVYPGARRANHFRQHLL
jgi:hypothetical protein